MHDTQESSKVRQGNCFIKSYLYKKGRITISPEKDWEEQNDDHKKQEIEKMHKRNMRIKKKSMRNTLFSA